MAPHSSCPTCGSALFAGRCLACDTKHWARFLHRELLRLLVLAVIVVAAFLTTRAVAADDERLRRRQALVWFELAQQNLDEGRIDEALTALRRAALKDRENPEYRLALGRTLAASGRDDQARRLLLALREERPEDAEAALALARLEARVGSADTARRYYEAALAALWRPEQAARRRELRLELIDLLLSRDERARALAQLLEVSANIPGEPAVQTAVGQRFLDAGEPRRALGHFSTALREDARRRDALVGAADAAFALGNFAEARRYVSRVEDPDVRVAELAETARLVTEGDPLTARIGAAERRRRLDAALTRAAARLEACAPSQPSDVQADLTAAAIDATTRAAAVRRRGAPLDAIEDGLDLAYRLERRAEMLCPSPDMPLDRALILIGQRRGLGEP